MAEPLEIQTFHNLYLAVHRPRKRTYYCLKYNPAASVWEKCNLAINDQVPIPYRFSTQHVRAPVRICIRATPRDRHTVTVRYNAEPSFFRISLLDGSSIIAPLIIGTQTLQPKYIGTEFVVQPGEHILEDLALWRIPQPRAPPPVVQENHENPLITRLQLTPIPKRIAWLIAEDAQKQGESCAISLEAISPLTASVTTCFHCFDSEQLQVWMASKANPECPLCKKNFLATKAFDETA